MTSRRFVLNDQQITTARSGNKVTVTANFMLFTLGSGPNHHYFRSTRETPGIVKDIFRVTRHLPEVASIVLSNNGRSLTVYLSALNEARLEHELVILGLFKELYPNANFQATQKEVVNPPLRSSLKEFVLAKVLFWQHRQLPF